VKGKVKPAEIHHELSVQYGEEMLSHASACDWHSKFSEGSKEILNLLNVQIQSTAICCMNICLVEELILGNRRIAVRGTASDSGICIRSVETVIHERVHAWWVPEMLMFIQNAQHVSVSARHLHWFVFEGYTFLEQIVTCDRMWEVYYLIPESMWFSMEWCHKES
jgi:hypothetical protein